MVEVLSFIFRNFWTWLGTCILAAIVFAPLGSLVRVVVKKVRG